MDAREILLTSIVAVLVSGIVGVVGMIGVYSSFPVLSGLPEPSEELVQVHEEYERIRNLASACGFFFGLIPIFIWQLYTRYKINLEDEEIKS